MKHVKNEIENEIENKIENKTKTKKTNIARDKPYNNRDKPCNNRDKPYYNTRESNKYVKFNMNDTDLIDSDSDDTDYDDYDDYDDYEDYNDYEDYEDTTTLSKPNYRSELKQNHDSNKNESNKNNTYIKNYINKHINNSNNNNSNKNSNKKLDNKTLDLKKQKTYTFYDNLIHYQPNLEINTIKQYINYFLDYTIEQQTTFISSFTDILDLNMIKTPYLFKIINTSLDLYYKKVVLNKIQLLEQMTPDNNEYFKLKQWIDTLLDIPFNIYKTPHYLNNEKIKNSATYLKESKDYMDTIIYGQQKTKKHIVEILAKMISNPKTLGSVFAIHGEAGTGKTTLIKDGLSTIFGLPFIFISLGGAYDRTFLAGSNYVYEGSACGKIIQSLKQSQCMNPIFYFDELDKVSNTDKGQEIINLLIHLTDYTQNSHFNDDYMDGIALDLSRATFIFSFNDKTKISPILLDRMEIIKFNSYTPLEKKYIAIHFLLPTIVKNIFGEKCKQKIELLDEQLDIIIANPTKHSSRYTFLYSNIKKINNINKHNVNKHNINKHNINKHNVNKKDKIINKFIIKKKNNNSIMNNLKNKKKQITNNKEFTNNKLNNNKELNNNKYGGVRYIKKRIEQIVSRMNVDIIMGILKIEENNIITIDNKYINNL